MHLYSFAIIIEMSDDLGWNNIQKHGEQTIMQNYLHDEDKGVREETIFLIFRWNTVLHDLYQADEIVTEIKEWKQKSPLLHAADMIPLRNNNRLQSYIFHV